MGDSEKNFLGLILVLFLGFSVYMLKFSSPEPDFVLVIDSQIPQVAPQEENSVTITVDVEKMPEEETTEETTSKPTKLININTATLRELITLSNIGEQRGQDIIDYRTEHGNFASIEDITKVSGIGDGIFSNIKDFITVG